MRVLIRGAGDLATGIAVRLHQCGFHIVMTEIAVPTTVRRAVAFSRAVYEGQAQVENTIGILCENPEDIKNAVENDRIAIIVDGQGTMRGLWEPDIMVDAIIAKENLGTKITDAKTVIGVGPGFTAGVDCHCVVETLRGHTLGRCLWEGSAASDTGVPGEVGGYSAARIIRTPVGGIFRGAVIIGASVAAGDLVGYVKETPVYAPIGGVVRGLLQDGVKVKEGMKAGDIDPRGHVDYCFTVSDKALSIGGGVLEAILALEKKRREK